MMGGAIGTFSVITQIVHCFHRVMFYLFPVHCTSSYVDYPVTDVLQMIGRANRPLIDDNGMYMSNLSLICARPLFIPV